MFATKFALLVHFNFTVKFEAVTKSSGTGPLVVENFIRVVYWTKGVFCNYDIDKGRQLPILGNLINVAQILATKESLLLLVVVNHI